MKNKLPKVKYRSFDPLQDYYKDKFGNLYSVARLIDESKNFDVFEVPIASLDLSSNIWDDCNMLSLAFHCDRTMKADLNKPIILDWNGVVADGRHRIIKSIIKGKRTIKAVRFAYKMTPCKEAN